MMIAKFLTVTGKVSIKLTRIARTERTEKKRVHQFSKITS